MRMCTVSRGRVLQLIAFLLNILFFYACIIMSCHLWYCNGIRRGAGLRRSGGERNPKCGNLRC